MFKLGAVELALYRRRMEHPVVIPQLDPSVTKPQQAKVLLNKIKDLGLSHVAIGGSIVNPVEFQDLVGLVVDDYKLKCLLYPTNSSVFNIAGVKDRTAIYWMTVPNGNDYFKGEMLVMNSLTAASSIHEFIPTTYVFDDRGSHGAANWFSRANPIPRNKPYISLAVALSAQYSGSRVYIMAGGSGCKLPPPEDHIALIHEKTDLFVIPTSGIRTKADAEAIFAAGGDAIHVGSAIETPKGADLLADLVKVAENYPGKKFVGF